MMDAAAIIAIFNHTFGRSHRTLLVAGGDEPLYEPAVNDMPARIVFRCDYVASALHEVAHWCIAGAARRQLLDYGYWYETERTLAAQTRFELAEVEPQAMEWILSTAAGLSFRLSRDNFEVAPTHDFEAMVQAAVSRRLNTRLPAAALQFARVLAMRSGVTDFLCPIHYHRRPSL